MKSLDHIQTMAVTYQEICQGEGPWIALGNFMNDWFDYAADRRPELVADPLTLPEMMTFETHRWATFCAASVEYLCDRYHLSCPSWVHNAVYVLSDPWFDSPGADKPHVRERLIHQTPEAFTKRNIYCGNRVFANKYEFAEQQRSPSPQAILCCRKLPDGVALSQLEFATEEKICSSLKRYS